MPSPLFLAPAASASMRWMAASLAGALPVIGIDPNPTRRALATIYGATHVIDPAASDVIAEIKKIAPQGR